MLRFMQPKVVDLTSNTPTSNGAINKQTRNPAKSLSAANRQPGVTSSKRSVETSRLTDTSIGRNSISRELTAGSNTGARRRISGPGSTFGQSQKENTVTVDVLGELDLSTAPDEWHGLMVRCMTVILCSCCS